MTLHDFFLSALGDDIEGQKKIFSLNDESRRLTVYESEASGTITFGFYCTKGNIFPPSKDWRENFKAWKKDFSVCSVKIKAHAGFVEEYMTLRNDVHNVMREHHPLSVNVVGYSQGGAHAALAYRDIVYNFPKTHVTGTTFGAPRVYGLAGAKEFEETRNKRNEYFVRFVNQGDPVPSVPPFIIPFLYKHVGRQSKLADNGWLSLPDIRAHLPESYYESTKS